MPRNQTPFCDWNDVPLVLVGIAAAARVLGRSARTIKRALSTGRMKPAPLPRNGGESWSWSKSSLYRYVEREAPAKPQQVRPKAPPRRTLTVDAVISGDQRAS